MPLEGTSGRNCTLLIYGYSMGANSAIGLTNVLTNNGVSVDQLTTVDPAGRSPSRLAAQIVLGPFGIATAFQDFSNGYGVISSNSLKNPGMVGDALNYIGQIGNSVKGARNEYITEGMVERRGTSSPQAHKHAEDITSRFVIQRIEGRLSQIFNRPQK